MAEHLGQLLLSIVEQPAAPINALSMLTVAEKEGLKRNAAAEPVVYDECKTLVDLWADQVSRTPGEKAVVFQDRALTFDGLWGLTNQMANFLLKKDIERGDFVVLSIADPFEMLAWILAVMKTGAAYVPVDSDTPVRRLELILKDTSSPLLISDHSELELSNEFPEVLKLDQVWDDVQEEPRECARLPIEAEDTCYLIYTSGTTGIPKGVQISHANVVDYLNGLWSKVSFAGIQQFALMSTLAADLGNTVVYTSLLQGGTLHLFDKEMLRENEGLVAYFDLHLIDCIKIVPSHWQALASDFRPLLPQKLIMFGGESLSPELVSTIRSQQSGTADHQSLRSH